MARKPRSPRTPGPLSTQTDSVHSAMTPIEEEKDTRDSVPTADMSAHVDVFALRDEPVVQIDDSPEQETARVRDIFSTSSGAQKTEEKDSLLMKVSRRRKKKQHNADDEVSALRQKRQASRRRSWSLRALGVALVLCLIAGGVYAAFFSPLFSLSLVEVEISAPPDSPIAEGDIRKSLVEYEGVSIVRFSTDSLARHIEEKVPGTDTVDVRRSFPHGLSISYSLKEPYACLVRGAACKPVDEKGRFIPQTPTTDIASLLHISYAGADGDMSGVMTMAHSVLDELDTVDESIRPSISQVQIDSRDSIRLVLNDKRVVVWGQASDNQTKARLLSALLSQRANVYDISAPEAPVTR